MDSGLSEVVQDFFAVATSILEGVGEDGKAVEGFLVIDAGGKGKDGGSTP